MGKFDAMTDGDLQVRHLLGHVLIRKLQGPWSDDPRAPEALARTRTQLAEIDAELAARGTPLAPLPKELETIAPPAKPAPQVIHAQVGEAGPKPR